MSLITYVGGAESDSFITVAEADAIMPTLPDNTEDWDELSTTEKELRLQMGAHLMGHMALRGRTVFRNQRLCFPRTCQPYGQRFKIPADVKKAQAFVAYSVVHRALANRPDVTAAATEGYGRPSQISLAGLVSVSFSGLGQAGTNMLTAMTRSLPFPVYQLMKRFLSQFRGSDIPPLEDSRTLSTTTSHPPITTTTTVPPVVTTTTSV